MIIDCHTHAFPDHLAARALASIESGGGDARHVLDGTVGNLLKSMDQAGIDKSLMLNIATKPDRFAPILKFCSAARCDRIIPFPSVHPDDPELKSHLKTIRAEGFLGIKLHPYYQDFLFDEERLFPLYASLVEEGLFLAAHTGYDISFGKIEKCCPERIIRVLDRFPGLKLMTTHLGAWNDYAEVRRWLIGRPIYLEISCASQCIPPAEIKDIIEKHGPQYVLFGSDSPWVAQEETLTGLRSLGLSPDILAMIEGNNARRFFGL